MSDLSGQAGELRMTVHIKRAATGETETHELIGRVELDEPKEDSDGGDAQHGGA